MDPDPQTPAGWNRYTYVRNNPVNYIDSTGLYGKEVHSGLTHQVAMEVGRLNCRGSVCGLVYHVASLLALGDQQVDEMRLLASPHPLGFFFHFAEIGEAYADASAGVASGEPIFMGAALHEIQDWYSHRNEGYGSWSYGHLVHSALAGCSVGMLGPCRRSALLVDLFYEVAGTEPSIRQQLGQQYGASEVARVSRDKLIDLYLYTNAPIGSGRSLLKGTFGYDTDYHFGFTPRDQQMRGDTQRWVSSLFAGLDPCLIVTTLVADDMDPPSEVDMWQFLMFGRYSR